jgi:hypothetical protein
MPRFARPVAVSLTVALAVIILVLAVTQVLGWDGRTNADGVSYLDLAAQYGHGDWRALANGYWSPLYPLLIGVLSRLFGGTDQAGALRLVFGSNIAILVIAALAFARLVQVMQTPRRQDAAPVVLGFRIAAAGAVCVFAEIRLINATTVTPDGLLAALLFFASAELALAARGLPDPRRDLRFGVLLALGCWTKAVFFPVTIVAIAAYVVASRRSRDRLVLPRVLLTVVVLTAPLVAIQSWSQGRPSFGETGRLNYRWYVLGGEHGEPLTEPAAETRRRATPAAVALSDVPGAVLFAGATQGSFPYWYDPSRYEPPGVGSLALQPQWTMLRFNIGWLRATAGVLSALAAVAIVAALGRGRARWSRLWMIVPAMTMLALYLLTHPEGRMGAGSVACVLLAMITLVDIGGAQRRWPAIALECAGLAMFTAIAVGRTTNRVPTARTRALANAPALAAALLASGLRRGSEVGVVGEGYGMRWAQETGTRIAVTVPPRALADPARQSSVLRAVAAESAARGHPLGAIVIPPTTVDVPQGTRRVGGGWYLWLPEVASGTR